MPRCFAVFAITLLLHYAAFTYFIFAATLLMSADAVSPLAMIFMPACCRAALFEADCRHADATLIRFVFSQLYFSPLIFFRACRLLRCRVSRADATFAALMPLLLMLSFLFTPDVADADTPPRFTLFDAPRFDDAAATPDFSRRRH